MDDTLGSNNSIDPFKLVAGEYVVHRKYGIGQFLGMKVLNVERERRRAEQTIFVPQIQRYDGED